jgi:chromosome segregation ATPase
MREEFSERAVKAEKALERVEGRLESSREAIENYEKESSESKEAQERLSKDWHEEKERLNARQSLMLAEYQERITELEEERDQAVSGAEAAAKALEQSKAQIAGADETLEQTKEEAEAQARKAERVLHRMQTRQVAARKTIEAYEQEIERLTGQLGDAAESIRTAQAELKRREEEWLASQEQAESQSVSQLREELSEVKNLVREFAQRPTGPDEETLNGLLGKLGERDSRLQEQIDGQLDRTLNEIDKSIRRATSAPIDNVVEATDVLVDRLFDHDEEMNTNLDELDVEERTSKSRISGNLERLKAAQQAIKSED